MTLDQDLSACGLSFEQWWAGRMAQSRQFVEISAEVIELLKAAWPGAVSQTLRNADQACEHRFDLLGSGPYRPVDGKHSRRSDGYTPIDWAFDPVRGVSFQSGVHHKAWNLYAMRPGNADIKFPWELARCQHFSAIGQAWRLTGERRYAHEIIDQIEDFTEANPVGIGVNWTCAMDVALRACNWSLGLALIKGCTSVSQESFWDAFSSLYAHGRFIVGNFEKWRVTTNHYLSNIVGLHFIAAEFSELETGRRWDVLCRHALEREMDLQVLPDGADFESSVPYHRLATELFLGSCALARHQSRPLSPRYNERLHAMLEFLVGVLRPDGRMPQVGDADDGRLCILYDWAGWDRQDPRHLLGPSSRIFGREDWMKIGGLTAEWEAAWWGLWALREGGEPGESQPRQGLKPAALPPRSPPDPLPAHVALYPHGGLFIARRGGNCLLVTNSRVGTRGEGNHKHNDQLGFELNLGGVPIILDPGCFVYTSDFKARNHFRSTAAHSTLQIDGVEQNEFSPRELFRMTERAHPEHLGYGLVGHVARYSGRHVGYLRLENPVAHERSFAFDLETGRLQIDDRLEGVGVHELLWSFQFAPGVCLRLDPARVSILGVAANGIRFQLTWPAGLALSAGKAACSPSYGVLLPAPVLRFRRRVDVAVETSFGFVIRPSR